jgi:hypothetical protein
MELWAFGWTQLLTIAGLLMTGYFARAGLRTFDKWRQEILEEKRIDVAFEALSIAYESKSVFEHVRSRGFSADDYADMPDLEELETTEARQHRGSFYVVLKRLEDEKDYFDRVWKLQPKVMAMFGQEAEEIFLTLHQARTMIASACELLAGFGPEYPDRSKKDQVESWLQMRSDIWTGVGAEGREKDRVGRMLQDFKNGIESLCRPTVDLRYKRSSAAAR